MLSLDHLYWNYLERNEANREIKLSSNLVPTEVRKSLHMAPRPPQRSGGDSHVNSLPLKSCMEMKFLKSKHTFNTAEKLSPSAVNYCLKL